MTVAIDMIIFLQPLGYAFMQRGLAAALIVGVVCAVIGCYVVLRGMAFLGDALAHAILPGVAIAYLVQANITLGALIAAILVALLIGLFSRQGSVKEDTAIGILFAAALSLGVALISSIRSYAVDLSHILFGNVLGVSSADLWLSGGLGVVTLILVIVCYKPFLVISFDPVLAATLRWPAGFFRNLLLVLLSITIVVSLQTVGVGLAAAVSALIGAFSSGFGMFASYYLNIASGAAIVLTATAFFLVAFLFAPGRGLISGKIHALRIHR
jgi:manganese/iron transport system permease protein